MDETSDLKPEGRPPSVSAGDEETIDLVWTDASGTGLSRAPATVEQFLELLVSSGLIDAGQIELFLEKMLPAECLESVEAMARALVQAHLLTAYQAEAIRRGQTQALVLGNYIVLDRIGAGGMGEVFKARHRRMDRTVALKMLPARAVESAVALMRFQQEVKAAAKLSHPNIVRAYDADEAEGIHFLVMEYVDGQDLAAVLRDEGTLSVEEALDYIVQASEGLDYAHAEGVIHRDIKPANLLLDLHDRASHGDVTGRTATIKILDMGLAVLHNDRLSKENDFSLDESSGSEVLVGTVAYMSPEQGRDSRLVDQRADIYSLGCTLFRFLVGQPPYVEETAMEVLRAHREAPLPTLARFRPDVPQQLDAIFRKMIAKDPGDRYQSIQEFLATVPSYLLKRPLLATISVANFAGSSAPAIASDLPHAPIAHGSAALQDDGASGWPAQAENDTVRDEFGSKTDGESPRGGSNEMLELETMTTINDDMRLENAKADEIQPATEEAPATPPVSMLPELSTIDDILTKPLPTVKEIPRKARPIPALVWWIAIGAAVILIIRWLLG